jgi:hypothetical protein
MPSHHTLKFVLLSVLTIGLIFSAMFTEPNQAVASGVSCPIEIEEPADIMTLAYNDQITFSSFSVDTGENAAITITNNTNCSLPLSLGSYRVFDQQPTTQKLHDSQIKTVDPQSTALMHVNLPNCMSQIDLYHDPNQDGPPNPPTYANPKLIGWTFQLNHKDIPEENDIFHFQEGHPYEELDKFPGDDDDGFGNVPEQNRCSDKPPLQVQCSVDPEVTNPGESIDWSSQPSGGTGSYSYIWTKDVTGNDQAVTETYTATGTKYGKVIVTSGNQQRSAQCEMEIQESTPPLSASCDTAPGQATTSVPVDWFVDSVSGGTGGYTYSWSGDADGSSDTVTESYMATGIKQATVTVEDTSGNEVKPQCSMEVVANDNGGGGGGGGNNGDFDLSLGDPFSWLVSNSGLRSTKTEIDLSKLNGFSKPVTLTAASANVIDNDATKFVLNGGNPQEEITVTPDQFSDPLTVHIRDSIDAASYPVTISAQAPSSPTKTAPMTLYVRSFMEF